jgi:hypothetical protein
VVRPSAASLNSLAEILHQAKPLYSECRLILNYLDCETELVIGTLPDASAAPSDSISANKDEFLKPQRILERAVLGRDRLM